MHGRFPPDKNNSVSSESKPPVVDRNSSSGNVVPTRARWDVFSSVFVFCNLPFLRFSPNIIVCPSYHQGRGKNYGRFRRKCAYEEAFTTGDGRTMDGFTLKN